jgi:hypothetical protein
MYSLYDERERGDSGTMSMAIWVEDGVENYRHDERPRLGVQMRVGSITSRTFDTQDWWQCTEVTEILRDEEDCVVFKTRNSTYTWRHR